MFYISFIIYIAQRTLTEEWREIFRVDIELNPQKNPQIGVSHGKLDIKPKGLILTKNVL